MSDSDSDSLPAHQIDDDVSDEEVEHDIIVAIDDIADFLTTQPDEFWPRSKKELDTFLSSFTRVPFELQPDDILPFLYLSKFLVPIEEDHEDLKFDIGAIKSLDLSQGDKIVAQFEELLNAKANPTDEQEDKQSQTKEKGKKKEKKPSQSTKKTPEEIESERLRPLRALVFKRIMSWMRYNYKFLEKNGKNMKYVLTMLKAVSRVYIEIDDKDQLVKALIKNGMIFVNDAESNKSEAVEKSPVKNRSKSKGSKKVSNSTDEIIWNEDEIDQETPLSRRTNSIGLKSLIPSSPLSAIMFALVFFLLYGSAILRTDVFSRLMDNDL